MGDLPIFPFCGKGELFASDFSSHGFARVKG